MVYQKVHNVYLQINQESIICPPSDSSSLENDLDEIDERIFKSS